MLDTCSFFAYFYIINLKEREMTDYTKLTTAELLAEHDRLVDGLEQDLAMDGSGELGRGICETYFSRLDAIQDVLDTRADYDNTPDMEIDFPE